MCFIKLINNKKSIMEGDKEVRFIKKILFNKEY